MGSKTLNVEMGDFQFQGEFVDTIGTQLILDESKLSSGQAVTIADLPIGSTERILLLDPIIKSHKVKE